MPRFQQQPLLTVQNHDNFEVKESTPEMLQQTDSRELQIRIVRTIEEVEALRSIWTSWSGHRDSDIDVVLMVIDSYPEAKRPHVIALYRDGEPEAILIGRVEEKQIAFKVGYLTLFRPKARCLNFVYGALRGNTSEANAQLMVAEVVRCLKNGEADLALFEFVPIKSALYQKALNVPGVISRDSHPKTQLHDFMDIPESIDKVYQRMSSERRLELRRKIKKLQVHPDGEMKITYFRGAERFEELFAETERVAQKTYQRGLGAGFSDTPLVRRRLGLAAEKGWLRGYLLYVGDRPVAFWIGMLCGTLFVGEYMGFDPEFRKYAPGMALMMKVLERFCNGADGDTVTSLDFGYGHAEYKAVLSTQSWEEAAIYVFSPTARGLMLKSCRVIAQFAELAARRILGSKSYLRRFKRWWRDHLAKEKAAPLTNKVRIEVEPPVPS